MVQFPKYTAPSSCTNNIITPARKVTSTGNVFRIQYKSADWFVDLEGGNFYSITVRITSSHWSENYGFYPDFPDFTKISRNSCMFIKSTPFSHPSQFILKIPGFSRKLGAVRTLQSGKKVTGQYLKKVSELMVLL